MKAAEQCYECLKRLAHQAASLATKDERLQSAAVAEGERVLRDNFSTDQVTIAIATKIHRAIREATKNADPYLEMKEREVGIGREMVDIVSPGYGNDLTGALKLAAVGNVIDFFRPIDVVIEQMKRPVEFGIDDSGEFEARLGRARKVLYLADNAGEVFFDLPLLQRMRDSSRVVYVVKGSPVQNDLTLEDIKRAGVESEVGEIITTGAANPGVVFREASREFKRGFETADLIFAKGMGYYESLSELPEMGRILYCLVAKCEPVAESLGVPLGTHVAVLR